MTWLIGMKLSMIDGSTLSAQPQLAGRHNLAARYWV